MGPQAESTLTSSRGWSAGGGVKTEVWSFLPGWVYSRGRAGLGISKDGHVGIWGPEQSPYSPQAEGRGLREAILKECILKLPGDYNV